MAYSEKNAKIEDCNDLLRKYFTGRYWAMPNDPLFPDTLVFDREDKIITQRFDKNWELYDLLIGYKTGKNSWYHPSLSNAQIKDKQLGQNILYPENTVINSVEDRRKEALKELKAIGRRFILYSHGIGIDAQNLFLEIKKDLNL